MSLHYQERDLTLVTPLEFARKVLEEEEINEGNLIQQLVSTETLLGLHAAYSPLHSLGIQGEFRIGAGELPRDQGGDHVLYTTDLTLDMDFGRLIPVDIGVQLVGKIDHASKGSGDLAGQTALYGFGIFYTGRENFSIGLNSMMSRFTHRTRDDTYSATMINIVMRYDI